MGGMEPPHPLPASKWPRGRGGGLEVYPRDHAEQTAEFDAAGNPYKLVQLPWPEVARLWLRSNYLFTKADEPYLAAAGSFDAVYCRLTAWDYLAGKGAKAVTLYNPPDCEMFKSVGLEATLKSGPMRWAGRERRRGWRIVPV